MSELKLLPCPFCGSKAETDTCENGGEYVCCPKCRIRVYVGRCGLVTYKDIEKAWNTRATPKLPRVSPDDLVEGEEYRIELDFEFGGTVKSKWQSVAFLDGEFWPFGYDVAFERRSVVKIWGPIPKFELEGEEKT